MSPPACSTPRRGLPALPLAGAIALVAAGLEAADCNGNGEDDAREIASGAAPDCNSNSVPDACDLVAPGFELVAREIIEAPSLILPRLADLNGDGLDDLLGIAAAERRSFVAYVRNAGGTFPQEPETLWTFILGGWGVETGDLDGDEDLDVVLFEVSSVIVLENDGAGRFSMIDDFPLDLQDGPLSALAADLDGDGDVDLGISGERFRVLANEGGMVFRARQPIADVTVRGGTAGGDLDRDGDTDIIIVHERTDGICVLRNDGAGGFPEIERYPSQAGTPGWIKALVSDVDGDGWQDILTRDAALRYITVLYNDGRGSLLSPLHLPALGHVWDLAVADLDVDGAPDLIGADYQEGMIRALLNSGGTFAEVFSLPLESPHGVLASDLDRDGRTDVVIASADPAVFTVFTNEPRPRSLDCDGSGIPDDCEISAGAAGDCNGNGIPDACDIERGEETDCNANGIPDDCDIAPPAVSLAGPGEIIVANRSNAITAADLDGDGDADLALTSSLDEDVSVLRNNGDGSFRARARFGVRGRPEAVLAADLDGDDDMDLVVPGEDFVNVLINAGGARFVSARSVSGGGSPLSAAVLDTGVGGGLDIIAANFASDDLSVLENAGGGAFVEEARVPTVARPHEVATGDLDGDGDIDLAVGSAGTNALAIHFLRDGGELEEPLVLEIPGIPEAIAAGDVDEDGDADIACVAGNSLVFLLASGGAVAAETRYVQEVPAGNQLLLSDLEGDLDLDIISGGRVARRTGDEYVIENPYLHGTVAAADLEGDGLADLAGVESVRVSVRLQLEGGGFVPWGEALAGDQAVHAATADLDGDADLDLVVVTDGLAVLENDGAGRLRPGPRLETDLAPIAAACGDLDGDGEQDIAAAHSISPRTVIYFNRGGGVFPLLPDLGVEAGTQNWALALADVEGDGDLDLLAGASAPGRSAPALTVWRNDGGGAFNPPDFHSLGYIASSLAAADFDGDGAVDVLAGGGSGLSLLRNAGDGTFGPPGSIVLARRVQHVATGDIDLDGSQDFAAAIDDVPAPLPELLLAFNDGGGAFPRVRAIPIGGNLEAATVALLDLSLDGALDVAVLRPGERDIRLFLNLRTREFLEVPAPSVSGTPSFVLGADMDGDRRDDLVLVKTLPGTAVALLNGTFAGGMPDCNVNGLPDDCDLEDGDCNANGLLDACELSPRFTLDDPIPIIEGLAGGGVATGDWDGDGRADLATTMDASPGLGQVIVLRNDGSGSFGPTPYPLEAPAGDLRAIDLDADGDLDLAAGTTLPGTLLVNDGAGGFEPVPITVSSSAHWAAADWNGDGRPDLGLTISGAAVKIFFQTGFLDFSPDPTFFGITGCRGVAGAHLDDDSRLDVLAIGEWARMLLVALQEQDGSFAESRLALSGQPLDLAASDLDADGDVDVVLALDGVKVLANDGSGSFGPPGNLPTSALAGAGITSPPVERIYVADMDGDASPDIIAGAYQAVYVLRNVGGGTFEPARRFCGVTPRLAFLDRDRDGDLDIAHAGLRDLFAAKPAVLHLGTNERTPPSASDQNSNGLPDECEDRPFRRGDANADGILDIVDPIFLLLYLFSGEKTPPCLEAADGNDDGQVDISDPIRLLDYLFLGTSAAPPTPGPPPASCGPDPEGDGTFLGCGSYGAC